MLDEDTRNAVLKLHQAGQGKRTIAIALNISRDAVTAVLKSGVKVPPPLVRSTPLDAHKERIAALFAECKGNFVRVHERLADEQIVTAYSTLTQFCRRQQISKKAKKPSGKYHFGPGQEMQHDTSPHKVKLGDKVVKMQCASLVMCYSRKVYAQVFYR